MSDDFLRQLHAGDRRGAAGWLVHQYGREVLSLCRAMVRDSAVAEDLTQDTFSRAFEGLARYRGESSPRSWLMTIAKNCCIDHLRRERNRPWNLVDEDSDGPVDDTPLAADVAGNRELVEVGMRVLDESHRALIVLRFQHGMDYSELGHAFGLRPATVRMRVSRALAKMRVALEPRLTEPSESAEPLPTERIGAGAPAAAPRASAHDGLRRRARGRPMPGGTAAKAHGVVNAPLPAFAQTLASLSASLPTDLERALATLISRAGK